MVKGLEGVEWRYALRKFLIKVSLLVIYFSVPGSPFFFFFVYVNRSKSFPGGSDGKASACSVGDLGSIPGSGRSSGEGNGNPLQYSCLENFMNGGAVQKRSS